MQRSQNSSTNSDGRSPSSSLSTNDKYCISAIKSVTAMWAISTRFSVNSGKSPKTYRLQVMTEHAEDE